jgi:tRNA A-37 threonylcarbamoyl transferase component Bud32
MLHEPGAVLNGRYEIEASIGQGGMGAVYRAHDRVTGQKVAVKHLRTDAGAGFDTQEMRSRFEGEWQLLRTLNHPRIPRMLDAFREGESGYYVMEFIQGKSLDQELKVFKSSGRRFPEELLLQYALQILDVLDYLHCLPRPLLHRDIKPQNIIVRDEDKELFLVDFGLAREGGSSNTHTLVGTLGYAPLEQVKGHPEPRSDLYALGATLWHMLVGEQPAPFDIPPLATSRNDVHPALAEVVDRACQDNVNRRYASARKMELAVRQAMQALTGQVDDRRYEELYLEETPEIVYQGAPTLGAREFLLRAGLASASFLLLMVVLYRVKHLVKERANATPTPVAITSATPAPAGPPPVSGEVLPPPPPLDLLPGTPRLQLQPATPQVASALPVPNGWELRGYIGQVSAQEVFAPAGAPAGVAIQSSSGPVEVNRLRLGVTRAVGAVNFQFGLYSSGQLVVGIVSVLEDSRYHTILQGGGLQGEPIVRPWTQSGIQNLELSRGGSGWELRDIETGQVSSVANPPAACDALQLIVPPARQGQRLGITSLQITGL